MLAKVSKVSFGSGPFGDAVDNRRSGGARHSGVSEGGGVWQPTTGRWQVEVEVGLVAVGRVEVAGGGGGGPGRGGRLGPRGVRRPPRAGWEAPRLGAWRPPLSGYPTPALRLAKPQPKATQAKASQNLEWPSVPGRRTPARGVPARAAPCGPQAAAQGGGLKRSPGSTPALLFPPKSLVNSTPSSAPHSPARAGGWARALSTRSPPPAPPPGRSRAVPAQLERLYIGVKSDIVVGAGGGGRGAA